MNLRAVRACGWLLGLLVAAVLLRLAATGDLASPPLTSVDGVAAWVEARAPVAAGVALVRLVAEVAVWYVLALSALHAAAHLLRASGGHRVADALALPGLRRAVRAGLGIGLVAASSVAPPAARHGDSRVTVAMAPAMVPGTATMRPAELAGGTASMRPVETTRGTATMRPVERPPGTATMRPVGHPTTTVPGAAGEAPATWTVLDGESLWSIAEEVLADTWGRPVGDPEVEPYWRLLVSVNRGRLVDASDPDLIHPGQVLEVPPVPAPPAV